MVTAKDVVARSKVLKNGASLEPIFEIAFYWFQITAVLVILSYYPRWWVCLIAFVVISTRQYALAILLHDAQHSHLHANKRFNNFLGRWLLAAPLGSEFNASRASHLMHHSRFGRPDGDPDYALYCFGQPAPKQSMWQLGAYFIGKMIGGKVGGMLRKADAIRTPRPVAGELADHVARLFRLGRHFWAVIWINLGLLTVLTWGFGWWGFPVLWALPLATLAAFYNDFRIFCEHSLVGRDSATKDDRLISFISNPVERLFFAPAHMSYHAEHHLFPYVPHRRLPALREAIKACPELRARIEWRPSYCRHVIDYIHGFKSATPEIPAQPVT